MVRPIRVLVALVFAGLFATTMLATPAAAAEDLAVSGTVDGNGFAGTIVDAEFEYDVHGTADLVVTGQLVGTTTVNGEAVAIDARVDAFAYVLEGSNCEELFVQIDAFAIGAEQDSTVRLDAVVFQVPERDLVGGLLGGGNGLFCEIDDLLGGTNAENLGIVVNDLLDDLGY